MAADMSKCNGKPLFLACSLLFAGVTQESTQDWSIQSAKEFPLTYIHHLRLGLGTLMSLLIRHSPMASYFWLSIIFLTPQILWHAPCWCDLLWHSCKPSHDHHWLYPIPITPLAWYHIEDLPYDLQTMLFLFSFLSLFSITWHILLWPDRSQAIAPCGQGLYHLFHCTQTLCSFYLSFVFMTFVSTLKKKEVFPQNSDLSSFHLIASPYSISYLHPHSHYQLSSLYCTIPNPYFTLLDTMSGDHPLLPNHTPQSHIGFILRSLTPPILVAS